MVHVLALFPILASRFCTVWRQQVTGPLHLLCDTGLGLEAPHFARPSPGHCDLVVGRTLSKITKVQVIHFDFEITPMAFPREPQIFKDRKS